MSDYCSEYTISQLSKNLILISELSDNEDENLEEFYNSSFDFAFKNTFLQNRITNSVEINETSRYFTNNSNSNSTSTSTNKSPRPQFITKNQIGKKRGRQADQNNSIDYKDNENTHNKYSIDNLLRKVQVHYFNFIISFLNDILKELNFTERFLKTGYEYKNKITKDYVESLKSKKISDIVCIDISSKYSTKDKETNKKIYYQIKDNEKLKKLFEAEYMEFFDIYYKSKCKYINLKKYGFEKEIKISNKTKIFVDLLKNNENDKIYLKNLNDFTSKYYMNNKFIMN